tara:strand:+ start:10895 stop:11461 length:567 start_codon:yes stop_codon:yes gene_type:complete
MKILAMSTSSLLLVAAMLSGCSDDNKAVTESDKADSVVNKTEQGSEKDKQLVDQAAQTTDKAVEKAAEMTDQVAEQASEIPEQVVDKGTEMAGQVTEKVTAAVQPPASDIDGESLYKGVCFTCHDTGMAGAPKLGDHEAWSARIDQGKEALYSNAINGKGGMPAKGGNPAFSDDEVKAIVDFMVSKVL